MAGHSKWANIQHRKNRQDSVRSKLFSKLSKVFAPSRRMHIHHMAINREAFSIAKERLCLLRQAEKVV